MELQLSGLGIIERAPTSAPAPAPATEDLAAFVATAANVNAAVSIAASVIPVATVLAITAAAVIARPKTQEHEAFKSNGVGKVTNDFDPCWGGLEMVGSPVTCHWSRPCSRTRLHSYTLISRSQAPTLSFAAAAAAQRRPGQARGGGGMKVYDFHLQAAPPR